MKKNVIVSLADSNYFELLNELINSIKRFENSKDTAICILDAGLSEDQKDILIEVYPTMDIDHLEHLETDIGNVLMVFFLGEEINKSQCTKTSLSNN